MRWLVLVLLLPTAAAQWTYDVDVTVEGPDMVAVGQPGVYDITWTVTCRPAASAAASPTATWVAQLSFEPIEGVLVSAPMVDAFDGPDCVTRPTGAGSIQWQIGVTPKVPGLVVTDLPITVEPAWGGSQVPGGSVTGAGTASIVPDYHGLLEAHVPVKLWQAEPGETTTVEVTITNYGNTRSTVDIAATGVDLPASWPPEGLEPLETRVLVFDYTHPSKAGWNNEQNALSLTLTPRSMVDEEKTGNPVTINLLGRTRGTPAPPLPLLLVGLALAARRR